MIQRLKDLARRTLVRNILALYVVQITNRLLPLIVIPFLARILEPTGWGLVVFAQAFAMYVIVVVEYGFEYAGTRAVARHRDTPGRLAELVGGALMTQLLLALLVTLVALGLRMAVPAFRTEPLLLWAALLFAILQGFNPVWYFVGRERAPLIAGIDTCAKLVATALIFVLVQAPDDGWKVLAAHAAGAAFTTTVGYAMVLREVRPARPSRALLVATIRLGFPMFLMRTSVMMHTTGNAFLLGLLAVPQQVAFFGGGEKLCRPLAWLLQPINVALLPRLANLLGHDRARADRLASLSIFLMATVAFVFGVTIWLSAPWIVPLVLGPGYEPSIAVLRVMALIVPLIVLNAALVSQWLVPHGLDRPLNLVIVSGTVLNFALALTLVPVYQAIGMAWVTVAVESYILIGLLIALRRYGLAPIKLSVLREGIALLAIARR